MSEKILIPLIIVGIVLFLFIIPYSFMFGLAGMINFWTAGFSLALYLFGAFIGGMIVWAKMDMN